MSDSFAPIRIRNDNFGLVNRGEGTLRLRRLVRGHFKRTQKQAHLKAGDLLDVLVMLNHPNLMRVYQYDEDWVEVEYVSGLILSNRSKFAPEHHSRCFLDEGKPIDLHPIKLAIRYMHAHGLCHADVVAHNIIVADDGTPKLIDLICCLPYSGPVGRRDRLMYEALVKEITAEIGSENVRA